MTIEHTALENKKVSHLIESLIYRTKEGKVKWERTVTRNRFMADLDPYTVSIRRIIWTSNATFAYSLDMMDADERRVVTLRNELTPDQGDYDQLKELFALAQDSASPPVEEGVDKLLQELERR